MSNENRKSKGLNLVKGILTIIALIWGFLISLASLSMDSGVIENIFTWIIFGFLPMFLVIFFSNKLINKATGEVFSKKSKKILNLCFVFMFVVVLFSGGKENLGTKTVTTIKNSKTVGEDFPKFKISSGIKGTMDCSPVRELYFLIDNTHNLKLGDILRGSLVKQKWEYKYELWTNDEEKERKGFESFTLTAYTDKSAKVELKWTRDILDDELKKYSDIRLWNAKIDGKEVESDSLLYQLAKIHLEKSITP